MLKPKAKLFSKEAKSDYSVIEVKGIKIGGPNIVVMAGPCAVEDRDEYLKLALTLKDMGVHILRGGAFKPRTDPYSFQGLAGHGLEILDEARRLTGLPVVTEVMDAREIERVAMHADILQIGSRNMQNFPLLREAGTVDKPVLLKRGLSATVDEWLNAAEYIMAGGNHQVIMCERGIRTFETHTRNTLDLSAVPAVKELSHLPVIVDPSHGTGRWTMVAPMAKAGVAAGADGLIIEVHHNPAEALCDGEQSLTPENFSQLMKELKPLAKAVGRDL